MTETSIPDQAQVVIVGGGIIGTSVAYHLTRMGWRDVLLLEAHQLTAGTTWHAAGLVVTFGSLSETSTELRRYTRDLYARLEQETGQATGFTPIGFIEAAADADRLEEYRRVAAFNRYCGVEVEEISPQEIGRLFPLADVDDLLAGFYVSGDGRVNPVDVTLSLARGARAGGATIVEGVGVTDVEIERGAVTGVVTPHGVIRTQYVVNCAGMWARELGERSGVTIPNQAAEHYYLITEGIDGIDPGMPVLEDPSRYGYYRVEGGGLMVGLFEPVCAPWSVDGIPEGFAFGEIEPDWERMTPFLEHALSRVPVAREAGIRKFFCGPESFTPDLQPIVGEAPEVKNYFVCAGLNSIGILTGGGLGRVMAHWLVNGDPEVDITGFNVDRLHPYQNNPAYRRDRTIESLGNVYRCHYPSRTPQTARGAKKSPFYDRLAERGAYFRDVSGWEGADWYAPPGEEARIEQLSWGRENWFPWWREEHLAAREGVVLIDMSFMSKFVVEGADAGAVLDRISANRVDARAGRITYTQWLNEAGRIEADLTVTKLGAERFLVVVTDTMHRHAATWLLRNTPEGAAVTVTDVTSAYGQLNVQGPLSRALLQSVTSADLTNEAFPFRDAREIDIGYARALCIRVTYVGELGYELYIPADQALHVYDRIVAAGDAYGLKHAGLKALASLRLEKGYRDYGHDVDNLDDPFDAGLEFAVSFGKRQPFIGRDALTERRSLQPSLRRLVQLLVLDPEPLLFHGEIVCRDGVAVGVVRAGSYGFTLGGAVGLAMLEAARPLDAGYIEEGSWEVDIAGRRFPVRVSLTPLYDPGSERVRM